MKKFKLMIALFAISFVFGSYANFDDYFVSDSSYQQNYREDTSSSFNFAEFREWLTSFFSRNSSQQAVSIVPENPVVTRTITVEQPAVEEPVVSVPPQLLPANQEIVSTPHEVVEIANHVEAIPEQAPEVSVQPEITEQQPLDTQEIKSEVLDTHENAQPVEQKTEVNSPIDKTDSQQSNSTIVETPPAPSSVLFNLPGTNVGISQQTALIGGIAITLSAGLVYVLHKKGYLKKFYTVIQNHPRIAIGIATSLMSVAAGACYYNC